jgi:hypothetical protein
MKNVMAVFAILVLSLSAAAAHAQLEIHGFVESASGIRLGDVGAPPAEWGSVPAEMLPAVWQSPQDFLMRETRLQLKGNLYGDVGEAHFVLDALEDGLTHDGAQVDLREGYVKFNAFGNRAEFRAGRQPTTWGTGDLLFINDLFPKDWVSFFIGREDQYLKRPSDAIRLGIYDLPVGVDVVYTPQFTPDNLPSGQRLAFWTPAFAPITEPGDELGDGELAFRLNRYFGSFNAAAYGYVGYWKSPMGMHMQGSNPTDFYYPELRSWGGSVRGPLFGGVAWVEGAYYDSADDPDGTDPLIPNSEIRGMAGYERTWWSDFTGSMQFYWEGMQDYALARSALDQAFGPGAYLKDENRTLVTVRLRQQLLYQTLTLGAFAYYSPSDEDSYVRFTTDYDYSDQLKLTVGANLFQGNDARTMFGMNDENDSVYARARLSF